MIIKNIVVFLIQNIFGKHLNDEDDDDFDFIYLVFINNTIHILYIYFILFRFIFYKKHLKIKKYNIINII